MNKYTYTAIDKKGEKIQGEMEALTSDEVAANLQETKLTPLKIQEKVNLFSGFSTSIGGERIPEKEKIEFLREFSTMISAGLPIDDALDVSGAQTNSQIFKKVLENMLKEIRSGSSLASALGKYPKIFSVIEINLVKSGEVSGKMDSILTRLADDIEKQSILKGKVRGALSYPIFVLGIAFFVIALITVKLVPAMQSLYAGFGSTTLPLPTEILLQLSNLLTNDGLIVLVFLTIIVLLFRYYVSTKEGALVVDRIVLNMPIIGSLVSQYQVVLFIKTYAMLIASGIPVITSLELVGESLGNKVYVQAIMDATKDVEKGVSLANALSKSSFIPSILWRSVAIGEETGKTEDILSKIGKYFEEQVNDKVNNLTRLLEPILLVVLGSIVGFIAISIYLPIYNFSSIIH